MAMARGRAKGYQFLRTAVDSSHSLSSSRHSVIPVHDHLGGSGLQAQRTLGGIHGLLSSQEVDGNCTVSSRLGFTTARGGISCVNGPYGRNNIFAVGVNQLEHTFPEYGVRYYKGGGRGRGGEFRDSDQEFAPFGEERREDGGLDGKDEEGDFPSDYRKLGRFLEQEVEKPENAQERLDYMRAREHEIMLQKFKITVVDVNRTFKVTKGGGEISFTAVVICGNGDGLAGWGKAKGPKATNAIREASMKSLNNLYYFERFKGQTIYHYVEGVYEKTKVRLWPEWTLGTFRAAGIVRGILLLAGIRCVKSKLVGSSNPLNTIRATFAALNKIKTPKEYEEKYRRAVVERHLVLDVDGNPHPRDRKVSSYVL